MTLQNAYVTFRLQLKDRGGNVVPMNFKSTITTTISANQALDWLVANVPPLTLAKLISASYTTGYTEDDQSITELNGEIEEKAEIQAALVQDLPGQSKFGVITIPAPVPGIFQATSGVLYNVLDPNNADVQTLLGAYEAGFGLFGALTLSDYQTIQDPTIAGNVTGKRIHKASRKG